MSSLEEALFKGVTQGVEEAEQAVADKDKLLVGPRGFERLDPEKVDTTHAIVRGGVR